MARRYAKALAALAIAQSANSHSWVETTYKISSTGSFVGQPGVSMGFINRTDPAFDDTKIVNKILDLTQDPVVCRKFDQGDYSGTNKPLQAAPGDFIALQYAENGHVTQPQLVPGKPYRAGNVYVYGTTEHSADDKLNDILNVWTADGSGGNKKGRLLATHYFDDGQCYQDRGAAGTNFPIFEERKAKYKLTDLDCQTDLQLPSDLATSGTYTLYWVWDWPTNNDMAGNTTEIYTSCAQIELGTNDDGGAAKVNFAASLPVQKAAISSQLDTAVEAATLGAGTNSPPAPTGIATQTILSAGFHNATATSYPTAFSTSSSSERGQGRRVTVTVTAEASIVTLYTTVTVGKASSSSSSFVQVTVSSTVTVSPTSIPAVTPFFNVRATGQARRTAAAGLA